MQQNVTVFLHCFQAKVFIKKTETTKNSNPTLIRFSFTSVLLSDDPPIAAVIQSRSAAEADDLNSALIENLLQEVYEMITKQPTNYKPVG